MQPVSFSSLTVGPLFPAAVHIGVTFLWSGPQGGSHNDSHLSVHIHLSTLAHTLSTKSKQLYNNVDKLMTFAVWISDYKPLWISGILISLCIVPSDRHHLFLHLSNLIQELRFRQVNSDADAHWCGPAGSALFAPCLSGKNKCLSLVGAEKLKNLFSSANLVHDLKGGISQGQNMSTCM